MEQEDKYWRRNLAVCLIGSFTTIVAMTLLLPFLPLYVGELGVTDQAAIAQWSGVAYGATFFAAALVAPMWGRLADRYGRKLMLVRASLGMAIAMSLMGMAHNVWELVGLRLFAGFAGGYSSGSTILVATQTPKQRSGWALGMLMSGIMAGSLVGPLIGGTLPPLIGIRGTFWLAGGVIFLAFLATTFLIKEEKRSALTKQAAVEASWSQIPDKRPVIAMLAMGMLLTFANMSIEPIITLYVGQLVDAARVTFVSGLIMSAAALGAILSASRLGKLADRIGHWHVIIVDACGLRAAPDPAGLRHRRLAARGLALSHGAGVGRLDALRHQHHPPQRSRRHRRPRAGLRDVVEFCRAGRRPAARRLCRRPYRHARGVSRHRHPDGARRGLCADCKTAPRVTASALRDEWVRLNAKINMRRRKGAQKQREREPSFVPTRCD